MKDNLPTRKKIRLNGYDYSDEGLYFITLCVKDRLEILGKIENENIKLTQIGEIIKKYIKGIEQTFNNVIVDEYIIMPNHIHIIVSLNKKDTISISRIIRLYKSCISKELGYSIWQKSFYEHIIRNEKEYYIIKAYIQNNIVNWKKDKYY